MSKLFRSAVAVLAAVSMAACSAPEAPKGETFTGEADGFGGKITAEVTVTEGKITALTLTGEGETPSIGGEAIPQLTDAILAAGTIEGVDGVSGATWTSNGVFAAIKNALGLEEETAGEDVSEVTASGLKQGLGHVSTFRLGPGKDDQDVPVYSFNEVFAYVITDAEDRIVDLEVDILETITPNHDGADDNAFAGWPGHTYNEDADGDGTVDGVREETEESWSAAVSAFKTKRQLGSAYKMNSGTWEQEMDAYEEFFKGKNKAEIEEAVATLFSDLNGRPLNGKSEKEEDVKKREALSEDQLAEIDSFSGATMSINDAHGNIAGAVLNALDNVTAFTADTDIASVGMGVDVVFRLGPGADDKDVPVYSYNTVVAGTAFDADGKIVETTVDILEIITPNHDGADDNMFTGWPGSSYNADLDADGASETVLEQTEESFTEQIGTYRTKRTLGSAYKMNSGTWEQEMDIYEDY